ncbi:hypothetical protein ACFORL_12560 [Legionella dresdenensis]|uniref:Uncharacterized protein n=1 Tax=Legionella dresdenensis TaxID=450200 RepID=A0ABV8CIL1_9GAMM
MKNVNKTRRILPASFFATPHTKEVKPKLKLKGKTLREIHTHIIKENCYSSAAKRLDVHHSAFARFLASLPIPAIPDAIPKLTGISIFKWLKSLTVAEAEAIWKEAYDKPLTHEPLDPEKITPEMIYLAVQETKGISTAAANAGIRLKNIRNIWFQLFDEDSELRTFEGWKQLSQEEVLFIFNKNYTEPVTSLGYKKTGEEQKRAREEIKKTDSAIRKSTAALPYQNSIFNFVISKDKEKLPITPITDAQQKTPAL